MLYQLSYKDFYKNLFLIYMIMMLKNDQNLRTRAKNILRLKKSEEHLFCILHKIMEIIYFSVNVRRCNIIFGVKFVLILFISFLPARVAAEFNTDCLTIPISSELSRFFLKIPNPDQYAIGIGKIQISTRVVMFSSNSHKRKRNAEYLTLVSREIEETARNIKDFLTKVVVRTPENGISEPQDLKISWGACPQTPLAKGAFSAKTVSLRKFYLDLKPSEVGQSVNKAYLCFRLVCTNGK